MADNAFPADWRDEPCFLVAIPRPLVPFVGGLLKITENRGFWATEEDYYRGYTAVMELEGCLMATCLDVLLQKQDALYRLINTAVRGQEYTVVSDDPLVVEPEVTPVVELGYVNQDSLLGLLDRQVQLIDNTINGTETPLYTYTPSVKEQLQAILDAMAADDTDIATIITDLELVIGALA